MPTKIVDIHPHIVSHDSVRYPVTPIGGTRSEWSKERSVTMEELIAAMDEAGVDKAAIVHSSTTYGFNNDYVVDAVAAYPKRFTGVFSVNVTEADAPERMRYWYRKGMTGMRIYVRGSTMKEAWLALDDPVTFPAWNCAAQLGYRSPPTCTGPAPDLSRSRTSSSVSRTSGWSSIIWGDRRSTTARHTTQPRTISRLRISRTAISSLPLRGS